VDSAPLIKFNGAIGEGLPMPGRRKMIAQQKVLAEFGDFALRSDNLDEVLHETCRLVGRAIDTGTGRQFIDGLAQQIGAAPDSASSAAGTTLRLGFSCADGVMAALAIHRSLAFGVSRW
jgi:hypothetical protein